MLKPFFCLFGGKWRAAPHYSLPKYEKIIEPFAGGAGYSLRHAQKQIVLYDEDPIIAGVWDYLIHATRKEIQQLPIEVESTTDLTLPQEAKWLIGFWLNKASVSPGKTPSAWMRAGIRPNSHWGEVIRQRIADQVNSIRHWKIHNIRHENALNERATWFIDPPYNCKAGRHYRYHDIDYSALACWCQKRIGQVIVCEIHGASWLPFKSFRTIKTTEGKYGKSSSREVVWENDNLVPCLKDNLK